MQNGGFQSAISKLFFALVVDDDWQSDKLWHDQNENPDLNLIIRVMQTIIINKGKTDNKNEIEERTQIVIS